MGDNYITYARFQEQDCFDSYDAFYALLNELETRKTEDESAFSFIKLYPRNEHTVLKIVSMSMKHNHVLKEEDERMETIKELKDKMENLLLNSTNDSFEKYVFMFQQMLDESHDEPLDFCQVSMGDSHHFINPSEASSDFDANKIQSSQSEASDNNNNKSCEDLGSFSAVKSTSLIDKMNNEMSNTRRTRKQTQKVVENVAVAVEKKSIVPHNLLTSVIENSQSEASINNNDNSCKLNAIARKENSEDLGSFSAVKSIISTSLIDKMNNEMSNTRFQNQSKVAKVDTTKLSHLLSIKKRTQFKNLSDQKKALFILKSFSIEAMAIESALSNEYVIGTSDLIDGLRVTREGILNMEENFLSVINDKVDAEVLSLIRKCYKDNKSKELLTIKHYVNVLRHRVSVNSKKNTLECWLILRIGSLWYNQEHTELSLSFIALTVSSQLGSRVALKSHTDVYGQNVSSRVSFNFSTNVYGQNESSRVALKSHTDVYGQNGSSRVALNSYTDVDGQNGSSRVALKSHTDVYGQNGSSRVALKSHTDVYGQNVSSRVSFNFSTNVYGQNESSRVALKSHTDVYGQNGSSRVALKSYTDVYGQNGSSRAALKSHTDVYGKKRKLTALKSYTDVYEQNGSSRVALKSYTDVYGQNGSSRVALKSYTDVYGQNGSSRVALNSYTDVDRQNGSSRVALKSYTDVYGQNGSSRVALKSHTDVYGQNGSSRVALNSYTDVHGQNGSSRIALNSYTDVYGKKRKLTGSS
ncbi:hypothetical protein TKK_0014672 [Trichogramma kaykai]